MVNTTSDKPQPFRSLRIFLCHSSGDKPAVRELYKRLSSDGVEAWLDEEDILPGQDWDLEIPKAVRNSDVVIICLSRGSVTKAGYVQKEIKFALDIADEQSEGTIFLIPVKLEECDVPTRLGRRQWVNLYEERGYERLMRSLKVRSRQIALSSCAPLTVGQSAAIDLEVDFVETSMIPHKADHRRGHRKDNRVNRRVDHKPLRS